MKTSTIDDNSQNDQSPKQDIYARITAKTVAVSIDSPDQGQNGIPITSMTAKDSRVTFAVDAMRVSYDGTLNADGSAIDGTWSQGCVSPLSSGAAASRRLTSSLPCHRISTGVAGRARHRRRHASPVVPRHQHPKRSRRHHR